MKKIILLTLFLISLMSCKKETPTTEVNFFFNLEYANSINMSVVIFEYDMTGKNIYSTQINSCYSGTTKSFVTQPTTKQIKVYLSWYYNQKKFDYWVMNVYQVNGTTLDITIDDNTVLGESEP